MKEIKICGLFRPEDIEIVNAALPDYAGFVIDFSKSHRSIGSTQVGVLTKKLRPEITSVGVFVDADVKHVARLLNDGIIEIAQLHGNEDNDYIYELQGLTDSPIWKAFEVKGEDEIAKAAASLSDLVLLDAGKGLGKTFNWGLLADFDGPFALAGGICMDNIDAALETDACIIDVSGGVETDRVKDERKVREMVGRVRS